MTDRGQRNFEWFLLLAVPAVGWAVGYGMMQSRVEANSVLASGNQMRIASVEARQATYEAKQASYEADIRWIKQTLLEIKDEIRK